MQRCSGAACATPNSKQVLSGGKVCHGMASQGSHALDSRNGQRSYGAPNGYQSAS